jgi:hypothetical protein
MAVKKARAFPIALLLMVALAGLSACGPYSSALSAPRGKPDSVQILIDEHRSDQQKPIVTLTNAVLSQQLYETIYALPLLPEDRTCTLELGPHYTLTFLQGSQKLISVLAQRDGCRPVSISGETADRGGTQAFWEQLDQAIYEGTPPATTQSLAIARSPDPTQSPETAQITSAETAQRLYNAILALSLAKSDTWCDGSAAPEYSLVFQAAQQAIPATIYHDCDILTLEGAYQTRGGRYTMNDSFKQLFVELLASATFSPAHPDELSLETLKGSGTSSKGPVADAGLKQRLYQKVFALPAVSPAQMPDCVGANKVTGKGTWYDFRFSEWGLPLLQISAFEEGSCQFIESSAASAQLQGDQEFWNLVHLAAGQH